MKLNFPACLEQEFPVEFPFAWRASELVIGTLSGRDFAALEKHSPALKGFNWEGYLRLSAIRMVRVLKLLQSSVPRGAKVLDFGAYFGNFALMAKLAGYHAIAYDSYGSYGESLRGTRELLAAHSVEVIDSDATEKCRNLVSDLDAVLLMGVLEHVPHTPRHLLEHVHSMLARSGVLILDTPNLGYIYTRQKLARGETIHVPIHLQYWTEIPFEGHHREYMAEEVKWMLEAAGFSITSFEAFNYSIYGLAELAAGDQENFRKMDADPALRELLLYVARPSLCT